MRVFISGPFRTKEDKIILEGIEKILSEIGHGTFIGAKEISNYGNVSMPVNVFWKRIIEEIKNSDIIIVNLKRVGIGFGRAIEAGIAKAFDKELILLYPPEFMTDECIEEIAEK